MGEEEEIYCLCFGDATTYARFSFDYVNDLNSQIASSENLIEKKIKFVNLGEDALHTFSFIEKLEKDTKFVDDLKNEYKNKNVGYISLLFGTTDYLASDPILESHYQTEFINRNKYGFKKNIEKIIDILSAIFRTVKFLLLSVPIIGEDIVDFEILGYPEDEGIQIDGIQFTKEEEEKIEKEQSLDAKKNNNSEEKNEKKLTSNEILVQYNRLLQKIVKDSKGKCFYLPVFEKLQTKLKKQKELIENQKSGSAAKAPDFEPSFLPFQPTNKYEPFVSIGVSWFFRYVLKWEWTDIGKRNQYLLTTDQIHLNDEGGKVISDLILMFFALED